MYRLLYKKNDCGDLAWKPGEDEENQKPLWKRTSHAWAKRNEGENLLWHSPICDHCAILGYGYPCWEVCEGHNPFDSCDLCGRGGIPYRRLP